MNATVRRARLRVASAVHRKRRPLGVAVGVLLLAAGIALPLYLGFGRPQPDASPGPALRTAPVVVTSVPITAGTQITAGSVRVASYAVDQVPQGAFSQPSLIVGRYAAIELAANQPLEPADLFASASAVGARPTTAMPPISLKDGDVAVAIPYDEAKGAAGYIRPDDRIDIIVDVNGRGALEYAFQDIRVIRVGAASTAGNGGSASMLLVEVTRAQALELTGVVSGKYNASIAKFVLRPPDQQGKGALPVGAPANPGDGTTVLTPSQWQALFPGV